MATCTTCHEVEARPGRYSCRNCYNAYMRVYNKARYERKRAETVKRLGSKCIDCGATSNLEFDHADRANKSFDVSKIWAYSAARFNAEIDKCVLRCKACHQAKTSTEQSVEHGGGLTGKRNCRCVLCAPLKDAYAKRYRKARAA